MNLTYNIQRTLKRREQLEAYMRTHVLNGSHFLCSKYAECRSSHAGRFFEGQLHHIGTHYDITSEGLPLRIMIVGQEYGHEPPQVTLSQRYDMIMSCGVESRFKADRLYSARNPHLKGTTSVLRLLLGIPLGYDHEAEYLSFTDGTRCHIFDAFALVNYLLCSAVADSARGKSTYVMKKNCQEHFRNALDILEPNIIIVQGKGCWHWIQSSFSSMYPITNQLYKAEVGSISIFVAAFTHPSALYPDNWGMNEKTPYLLNTVVPTVSRIREELCGVLV